MTSNNLNWSTIIFMVTFHIMAIVGLFIIDFDSISLLSIIFLFIYISLSHLSVMSGWHRYYVHRSFVPTKLFEYIVLFFGSSIFTGSVKDWVAEHSSHHTHLDNHDRDPTSIKKGFFYSHIGWLLYKKEYKFPKGLDSKTLEFHHNNWLLISFMGGLIVPSVSLYLTGMSMVDSILLGTFIRSVFSQHCLFLVGSWSHFFGKKFKDSSATNSLIVSFFCFGEGYHYNHHTNPRDYRAGNMWYDYDPGKWFLYSCYKLGLIKKLIRVNRKDTK
jgi:stearoyl-CoA desaturase (delta-9 desaturase)